MNGTLTLGELSVGKGPSPWKVDFSYTVPPLKDSNNEDKDEDERSAEDRIKEGVRDAKIKILEVDSLLRLCCPILRSLGSSWLFGPCTNWGLFSKHIHDLMLSFFAGFGSGQRQ